LPRLSHVYDRRTAFKVMVAPIAAVALGTLLRPYNVSAATLALYDFEDGTRQGWAVSGAGTAVQSQLVCPTSSTRVTAPGCVGD
jgi:hypothetical protein